MPRVLDGGHGPHQAAARCVGTSRTDLGIAIVLVCSALRAGWSAGAATRCLKVTVYAFYATGARSNSSATRPDMASWAAFWALRHRVAMRQVRASLLLGCRARARGDYLAMPFALAPAQLLWVNLRGEMSAPALAPARPE